MYPSVLLGLNAYWPCNEIVSSDPLRDALGQHDLAVGGGAPLSRTAIIGGTTSLHQTWRNFTSADGDYFTVADNPFYDPGDTDFSFSLFVLNLTTGANKTFLAKSTGSNFEYFLRWNNTYPGPEFGVSGNGSAYTVVGVAVGGSPSVMLLTGYHDSVNNVIGIHIIVQGSAPAAYTQAHTTGVFNGTSAFQVGRNPGSTELLDGRLSGIGYWNRVLTLKESVYLFNQGLGRTFPFYDGRLLSSGARGHGTILGKRRTKEML